VDLSTVLFTNNDLSPAHQPGPTRARW
jgi:hypothetical protein